MKKTVKQGTALAYVIKGLVPYTQPNLKLVYKPAVFFRELSILSGKSESSLRNALTRAKHENLIEIDESGIVLKRKANRLIDRFRQLEATPLRSGHLLVLFDIPQTHDRQRRIFVQELRALRFENVQKSVWSNDHDHRGLLMDIIAELKIGKFVAIAITHPVFGSHFFEN